MNFKSLLFCLLTLSLVSSCQKGQLETDVDIIEKYLDDNGLTADRTTTGLHYIITDPGTGDERPTIGTLVTVNYKGYFTDGTVFDESEPNEPFTATIGQGIIQGWSEGLQFLRKGGTATLLIPSKLAYGRAGTSDDPQTVAPNTVLIFDVELVDF